MRVSKLVTKVGLIALAGMLAVAGAWYELFWRPETSHWRAEAKAEVQAAGRVSSLEGQLAALEALQKKVPLERLELAKAREEVPDGPSLDQLLVTIVGAASKAGVSVQSIGTPEPSGWGATTGGAASTGSGPAALTLPIGVTGSPEGVLKFVEALDSSPRLYVVTQFQLNFSTQQTSQTANASPQGTSLTVMAFYVSASPANPVADFPVGVPGASMPSSAQLAAGFDFTAKAAAVKVLSAEMAYWSAKGHLFLDGRSAASAEALRLPSSELAASEVLVPGQVLAEASANTGVRWSAAQPGAKGRSLLIEALSGSGRCFYVAAVPRQAGMFTAFAETEGGCTTLVAMPKSVAAGSAKAQSLAQGGYLPAGAWAGSW
jgi:Tfp pilus assembly protein PilO